MHIRLLTLTAALAAGVTPTWATALPAFQTYSAAADFGTNFFGSSYTPLVDTTSAPGTTAQISGTGYTASASTTLGSNRAYASVSSTPSDVLGAGGFSGWYDEVTITGGTGTGTARFTVQLTGTVDVGAFGGSAGYTLGTSSVHPSELASSYLSFNVAGSNYWPMDAVNPIATFLLGASPYNDTSILFPESVYPVPGTEGIPIVSDPGYSLGDAGMGFPQPDLILTPGFGQSVDITLQGTLNFTYGESFYLVSGLGVTVLGEGLDSFCTFEIDGTCTTPDKDGAGATTLDFSNSANLVSIALPQGATANFASGASYNVTAVPEPAEWAMLLVGLGLVGWRAGRRT